jgi:manganese oxidase
VNRQSILGFALAPVWLLLTALPLAAQARPSGVVVADVVALDQAIVYNRFGSHNPYGMIYALSRDVIDLDSGKALDQPGASARPCRVALRSDKRPRPLVMRGNVGDKLEVNFTNLLCPSALGTPGNDPYATEFMIPGAAIEAGRPPCTGLFCGPLNDDIYGTDGYVAPHDFNRPNTRIASMMFNGVTHDVKAPGYNSWDPRQTGIAGIEPGQSITYRLVLEREGAYLFYDNGAPAGGEGDGGSNVMGLYGMLNVEPTGSNVYHSDVRHQIWKAAQAQAKGKALLDYEAVDKTGAFTGKVGRPLLNMFERIGTNRWQLVHADINAVVQDFAVVEDNYEANNQNWFREFTSIFQDELKTVQAYKHLIDPEGAGSGIRDGYGINYGASGLGSIVAANRMGEGPAASCVECSLEDFFLTSWANGDPAMVVRYDVDGVPTQMYPDDPGNVHHNYLGDPVKFRTVHAGVKETHVFHLHANQWFGQNGTDKSTYLDSQTLGPQTPMSYGIAYAGSNRNLSVGDAIYHCHMYPHFAQGMWYLWRNHDVLEDGSRRLPDGELGAGTDPLTGITSGGAFSPGVIPIRGNALPPAPTYGKNATPGYPFFVAGRAGHRPPQPPLDLAADSQFGPTGIGRHVVLDGTRTLGAGVAAGDLSSTLTTARIELLPHEGTPLERAAMAFHGKVGGHASKTSEGASKTYKVNGKKPMPGAPFADPCPATAPVRRYDVSAIQLDLVVNKAGWHDPQARINVLSSEVGSYEGQKRTADPFFFRAHSGDCIVFNHTNRTPHELQKDAFQARTPTDTIGQHIHLVKFDVMASDGGGNGWNYEDGTFARGALRERAEAARNSGLPMTRVRPNGTTEAVNPLTAWPDPHAIGYQTTTQRWWADELYDKNGVDRTLRTVFTHDHFAPSSIQQHGFYNALVVEPKGSEWLQPDGQLMTTGVGPEAIIQNAADEKTHPDYREFMLASSDFSLLYTADGRPVDPPFKPEAISSHHHNPFMVNYKNEPIPLRLSANGERSTLYSDKRADHAYLFSSEVHGDPFTPVLKAYEGERVQIRLIHSAQEVQQVFTVHGQRWKREGANPDSPYVGAQEIGISEHFEIDTGRMAQVTGGAAQVDYLYHYGTTDALWNGAWGILRTYDTPDAEERVGRRQAKHFLRPLKGRRTVDREGLRAQFDARPDRNVCPRGAPQRGFDVQVWAARDLLPGGTLMYNQRVGIHDPTALMYVHANDVEALRNGWKAPEPFVMRANAGDCLSVKLTNMLPADQPVPDLSGDAPMPTTTSLNTGDLKPSHRVGMHAQLVHYDPRTSDGTNVGYNPEQLAAPGETRNYTWFAGRMDFEGASTKPVAEAVEYGSIPLRAMGDVVKHGAQGMIGSLIVEPAGATYWDESNLVQLDPNSTNSRATIRVGNKRSKNYQEYKEFVLMYQDGLNLRQSVGGGNVQLVQHFVGDDSYDMGERGLNYRTEPLWGRIDYSLQAAGSRCTQELARTADINPCKLQATLMVDDDLNLPDGLRGLPVETPIFEATDGEAVKFRVLQADGRARMHSFRVIGHNYADLGLENYITPGNSFIAPGKGITASLYGGAKRGYWLYRDGPSAFVNTGMWGLFKVR